MAKKKSKELVFESDRIEKKRKILRILVPACIIAGILLLTVVIALIVNANRKRKFTGGEDTPYPYRWTENKDGSILLEIKRPTRSDYRWKSNSTSEDILKITSAKASGDRVGFLLTPGNTGRVYAEFYLQKDAENAAGRVYEIVYTAEVTENNGALKTTFLDDTGRELPKTAAGGETEGFPYEIYFVQQSELEIRLTDKSDVPAPDQSDGGEAVATLPEGVTREETQPPETDAPGKAFYEWECISSNEEVIRPVDTVFEDGLVTARLALTGKAGVAEIMLIAEVIGEQLIVGITVSEDGTVEISSHRLEHFDAEVIDYTGEEIETITEEGYKEPETEDAGNTGEEEAEGETVVEEGRSEEETLDNSESGQYQGDPEDAGDRQNHEDGAVATAASAQESKETP